VVLIDGMEATLPPVSAERRWVAIEHVPYEGPAAIATAAAARGLELEVCRPYLGEALPAPGELAGLIVMGGPMGVSDVNEHPHLIDERQLVATVVRARLPLLGVCLGAQLLAWALGAAVYLGPAPEIGPGRVTLTAHGRADPVLGAAGAGELPVVHWHAETFDLPTGAVLLASSAAYVNQAFRVGTRAYGLQFHIEVDRELSAGWREHLPAGAEIGESACVDVERRGRAALEAFFALADSS
jgi:GMP synthase-like glutamine amidotransferase